MKLGMRRTLWNARAASESLRTLRFLLDMDGRPRPQAALAALCRGSPATRSGKAATRARMSWVAACTHWWRTAS